MPLRDYENSMTYGDSDPVPHGYDGEACVCCVCGESLMPDEETYCAACKPQEDEDAKDD